MFASRANADRISDDLEFAANGIWIASAVVPWQGDEDGSWLAPKTAVLLVQAGATLVTSVTVGALKDGTARMRPRGEGATSFPSDHAASVGLDALAGLAPGNFIGLFSTEAFLQPGDGQRLHVSVIPTRSNLLLVLQMS